MNFKYILAFAVFCLFSFPSCGHEHGENGDHTHEDGTEHKGHDHGDESAKKGKEFTSAFICPMYCEGSGSDKEGKCPVCKMDYIANKNKGGEHDGHNHGAGDGHDHNHGDGDGHNHGDHSH